MKVEVVAGSKGVNLLGPAREVKVKVQKRVKNIVAMSQQFLKPDVQDEYTTAALQQPILIG